MTKQKTILICIALIALVTLVSISATIYQTPGYVNESENVTPEVPVPTDVQEDSTNEISTFWIFMIVIIFIILVYLVIKKRVFKKRKKIENHSQRKKDEDSSRGNHLEPRNRAEEDNLARDMSVSMDNHADTLNSEEKEVNEETDKIEEEFDELMKDIGLDEVIDKIEENPKEEEE